MVYTMQNWCMDVWKIEKTHDFEKIAKTLLNSSIYNLFSENPSQNPLLFWSETVSEFSELD